jgi:hypothetical protein
MFHSKSFKIMALSITTTLIFGNLVATSVQANTIKKTSTSKAGRVATPGINTLLSGKGAPKSTLGIDGDFYIDTSKTNLYGPKTNGKWPAPVSLKGTAGTNGTNGTNGLIGATGATGAKGTSTNGSDGAPGPSGASGSTGATGPAGSGSPGANGAPGINGSPGTNGTNGTPGSTGGIGPRGDTGTVGLTGPAGSSPSTMGLLTFAAMIGELSSTSVMDFGNFALGKNYIVQLLLHGVAQDSAPKLIKLAISSPDSSVILKVDYVVLNGITKRSGRSEEESSIIANVLVDGTNTTHDYYLTSLITCNERSVSPGLVFSGSFTGIQVGSIS